MKVPVLCVDDDENVLRGLRRALHGRIEIDVAASAQQALEKVATHVYAVIVSDMYMPGVDGVALLREVQRLSPDTTRIMLTGHADLALAIRAVHEDSVFRFLTKPCPAETLAQSIEAGIRQHRLVTAEKELLEKTLEQSLSVLTDILAVVAPEAFGRAQAVRSAMGALARHLRLADVHVYELAALLAPIGLVTIPPSVLAAKAKGKLALDERQMLARVPEIGADLLARIPRLEAVVDIVRYQARCYEAGEASAPADGLTRGRIPLGARMLLPLADRQALLEERAPRASIPEALRARKGAYDPAILAAIAECFADEGARPNLASVRVPIAAVRIGSVLAEPVTTRDQQLLLAAGKEITEAALKRLQNFASLGIIDSALFVIERAEGAR